MISKKFKTIIIDDEEKARKNLKLLIEKYFPELEVIGEASSAITARRIIVEQDPEVVFVDIHMPEMNGIEFLRSFDVRSFVSVIVSAHSDFGIDALRVGVLDYLVKPIVISDLQAAVNKIIKNYSLTKDIKAETIPSTQKKIALSTSSGIYYSEIDRVLILKGEDNYTKVLFTDGKELLVSKTLKDFERSLPSELFFRIHKSCMINAQHVKEYNRTDGGYVLMIDGSRHEISKNNHAPFLDFMKNYSISIGK
ncbi:MAG: LytTR family DNA-binding domain-containing protein [Bacteroidota bacterium]|nr:LytTR family DNA-binding domain-containing protein [Bacteroidota bacterium]